MHYTIDQETTVINALQQFYPDSSKSTLVKWIKWGKVLVNDSPCQHANIPLLHGHILEVTDKGPQLFYKGIRILYEDRYLVVIDKPSGLLSVPDHTEQYHALGLLRRYFETDAISAVHRIDRETSGLMIFARGKPSADAFDELFEKQSIHREYVAIIEGHLKDNQGTWNSRLVELPTYNVVSTTNPNEGKIAISHFQVYRKSQQFSFLNVKLETGRKHQIRVHCKDAGHPILGDKRYGSELNPVKRMCLHSHKLQFTHPFTQKPMTFIAPLPKHFITLGANIKK